ncbi:MAG: DUF6273 domain-containing protein [Turicibacter sp.]|nr:DUF6273 domain-containing protein [Turicibacter sp.]
MECKNCGAGLTSPRGVTLTICPFCKFDNATKPTTATTVGDIITFSGYNWRVLDIQNNQALLLSELILEDRKYNESQTAPITWEKCTLRHYLNNDFYNKLSGKDRIARKTIYNNNNPWFGASGGNNTTDYIFLLSIEEMVQYFGDSWQLKNKNPDPIEDWRIDDQFNQNRIAKDTLGAIWWWLRSPGGKVNLAAYVERNGKICVFGNSRGVSASGGVRPALWLNL